MKKKHIVVIALTTMIGSLWLQCMGQSKKALYELPDAMLPSVKEEYTKQCDKGVVLYAMNCAKCHNTTVKGKEIIPDFSPDQLVGYEIRVKNPTHESDIPETTVTTEELGYIMTFLSYKKKNK